ncbi:MAG TPA: translation elongation factor Ts [bacterium]|jgi:elongation factor Ts|nr:translation elongation factor Ts [bacterium]HQL62698.1 translation elongation factor Ts [bacterium]
MEISATQVKELREKTGAGMMDCKKALTEAGGDMERAIKILREKGIASAAKRAGRVAKEGVIFSYVHPGNRIGVLVEVNCETDFVARNEQFQQFAKDIAMHVAASSPQWVSRDQVPASVLESEREVLVNQAKASGKPEKVIEKMVEGRLEKFYGQVCLLEQPFVKNPDVTVQELLKELIGKIGENIVIRRFARFQLGEE